MSAPIRILVVEDEPLISMMIEDFLDILGHEVAGLADSIDSAMPLVEAGGIDAAILDVNLRGGEKIWPIADALADRGVPFVLATGGGDDSVTERHRSCARLPKPFTMDGVERALSKVRG